jgi:oligosaccharyltransferase complex subunit beta
MYFSGGLWRGYRAGDVQLEFVMLDPYVRKFLVSDPSVPGRYTLQFRTPDVYGVFKLRLMYKRKGYNLLHKEEVTPVRNFKHNDYERFIWCAAPYYASCGVSVVGVLLFCFFFLYHRDKKSNRMNLTNVLKVGTPLLAGGKKTD